MLFKVYLFATAALLFLKVATPAPRSNKPSVHYLSLIADRGRRSAVKDEHGKIRYESVIQYGELKYDNDQYSFKLNDNPSVIHTKYSHKGRGAEFSELLTFNGKYYTMDDKTGIVFEVDHSDRLIPWTVLASGNGKERIGFKGEWATIKKDLMFVGSLATEYVDRDGRREDSSFWVKVINSRGYVISVNWRQKYERVRTAMGITYPGFVWHEAVNWSPAKEKWIFMPRKCSTRPYDTHLESVGCNKIVVANENFTEINSYPVLLDGLVFRGI